MSARMVMFLFLGATLLSPLVPAQSQTAPAQTQPAGPEEPTEPTAPPASPESPEPDDTAEAEHVRVQHVLIGFRGSVRGKTITRTLEEARTLAGQVLERARSGESFDALVRGLSDDDYPGVYAMTNNDVEPLPGEFRRAGMVKGFGDVAFSLEVDEIGMAEYDPSTSRYGWHIIKRID